MQVSPFGKTRPLSPPCGAGPPIWWTGTDDLKVQFIGRKLRLRFPAQPLHFTGNGCLPPHSYPAPPTAPPGHRGRTGSLTWPLTSPHLLCLLLLHLLAPLCGGRTWVREPQSGAPRPLTRTTWGDCKSSSWPHTPTPLLIQSTAVEPRLCDKSEDTVAGALNTCIAGTLSCPPCRWCHSLLLPFLAVRARAALVRRKDPELWSQRTWGYPQTTGFGNLSPTLSQPCSGLYSPMISFQGSLSLFVCQKGTPLPRGL